MTETGSGFWLKLLGGLLLVSALVIIFLGNRLFEQSTLLTQTGKDLSQATAERNTLAILLAELSPSLPEAEALALAERSGLSVRAVGDGPAKKLIIEGLVFELRDGVVDLDLDPR